jgi:hypothetical protein
LRAGGFFFALDETGNRSAEPNILATIGRRMRSARSPSTIFRWALWYGNDAAGNRWGAAT